MWNLGKARHRDPTFPAPVRLRPPRPVRMRFQAAATAMELKEEYSHSLPAAHMLGQADYMRARIDHIRIPARAEYIPALAVDILVPVVDNSVPAENILVLAEHSSVPAGDIPVPAVHKRATAANTPAPAEHKRLAAD